MSSSGSLVGSINTGGSTTNSDTGGTLTNSDTYPSSTDPAPQMGNSDKSIYTNCASDAEYFEANPSLPAQIIGNGTTPTITGTYNQVGSQITITSSSIKISFISGILGALSIPFSGIISGNGASSTYLSTIGLSDQTVPVLPVNITITISNGIVSNNKLSASITIVFSAAFLNLVSNQPQLSTSIYAPGSILNEPFVGTIAGALVSNVRTLQTITFTKNVITHNVK